jgi:primosomal protein N' (replication factor Y) (superfamily II helicase)
VSRICRVAPDVTAVEREFDYLVPERFAALVRVGSIVRVPLHGRRVRGWVVADNVEAAVDDADRLLELAAVVSEGPPAEVIDLAGWIAWRWAGPRVAVLRSASPPNRVAPLELASERHTTRAQATPVRILRRPPLLDRRETVASMLAEDGSSIVCVADGARAGALARSLQRSGRRVALLHSAESDAARTNAWRRAAEGDCIVVGGRVAALAPVPDLRAAVVVDDADEALQEERAPTWHARDVLAERAARAGVRLTVLSPAPTVEALAMTTGEVETLPPDVEAAGWPRALVVDRRADPPGRGLLSDALVRALQDARGLAVCVLNRRGRFRVLVCDECRTPLRWDGTHAHPAVCPQCGATRLRTVRAGVTRVREELAALVPRAQVVDVDATTAELPDANILVGTEAVLHRQDVRRRRPVLVAFLDLDQELLAPRYRAATQAHWLLTRGAQLLAGRDRSETLMLLQTRLTEHAAVQAVVRGMPSLLTEAERDYRSVLGYPPFGALAELRGDEVALQATADALRGAGSQVFGPSDERALALAPTWDALADALAFALPLGRNIGRVRATVDPARV